MHFTYVDSAWSGGVAISPNSRFLYVSSFKNVYQYDLWAEDIPASKDTVAVWDGFMVPPVFATTFFLMQLGPDGKIYINSNNAVPYLHVINNPDLPGDSCDVCQHCVALPSWNSFSLPNFPNYRLGHLQGSPCDTLRQPPTAAFGYEQAGAELRFADSSYHDIRSWHWDFGDGQTDTVPSPVYMYDSTGLYQVCLTVANPRGEDMVCEEVAVVVSGKAEVGRRKWGVQVYPGLFRERFAVLLPEGWQPQEARLLLYDGLGRRVLSQRLRPGANEVAAERLSAGVYFYVVEESGMVVARGRVVKQ
ncbi:MAG: PKD domain-containing protein [Phaeodactylibacter sp.]|nr:PKD domain-containing protein [Phaeodactylibacter sp.]MCB9052979.1 PKD domain-containing protein [Lewinellaceae bacterium]